MITRRRVGARMPSQVSSGGLPMITLYTHPMSPCAQKVRLVLAEKGLEWSGRHIDLPSKENLQPWYLELNPIGVVPTLVHEEKPVIESSIICEYLEDKFPDTKPMRPSDAYDISVMRFWMKHVDNKLHPSCGTLQWPLAMLPGFMKLPEAERKKLLDQIPEKPRRERQKRLVEFGHHAPDVADAVKTYRSTIAQMEKDLANKFWVAGDFSMADCSLAPYFQTLLQYGWTEFYEAYPRVADWYARVRERDSYKTAVAADFSPDVMTKLNEQGKASLEKITVHWKAVA